MARRTPSEKRPEGLPIPEPWKPAQWDLADASAIQALSHGNASSDQQQRALRFIVERLARTYDLSFRASSDRETAFAEGGRWVGLQLVKLISVKISAFTKSGAPGEQG